MEYLKTDLCIIGAGSGGLSLAAGAAQLGVKVVLVEADKMGGDCLNVGCIPSKALIAAGKAAHQARGSAKMGVTQGQALHVDLARAKAYVAEVIAKIAPHDSQDRFEGLGVTVIRAWGRFTSPKTLEAGGHVIKARRFVIATGSRASVPLIAGLDSVPYLTNETIFDPSLLPRHLLIIGAGPIGVEMAQAHVRLGVQVSLIDSGPLLGCEDPDLTAPVAAALRAETVALYIDHTIKQVAPTGPEGSIRVTLADGTTLTGSHLLMATGRQPQIVGLGLDVAGVKTGKNGVLASDDLRTSNKRIYVMGDAVQDGLQFTHVAGTHAGLLARRLLFGLRAREKRTLIPRVTYSDPELAQVGLTLAEARAHYGDKVKVITQSLKCSDRAQTQDQQDQGLIKLIIYAGRPIGVGITAPHAGELISLWTLVLTRKISLSAVAGMTFPYPTLSEISKQAVRGYFSPKLFGNLWIRAWVLFVQRYL